MPGRKAPAVLIVEDNAAAAKTLELILAAEGFRPACAADAAHAVALAAQERHDAALIDLSLPGSSGLDLLSDLKAVYPDLVVIIITGHASTENSIEALNRGATAYIRKPVDVQHLLATLRSNLERKRLEEENWRMLRRLSLLHAIGTTVSVGLEPESTLDEAASLIASLLELPAAAIWWGQGRDGRPLLAGHRGFPEAARDCLAAQVEDLDAQTTADPQLGQRPWFEAGMAGDGRAAAWRVRLVPLRGQNGTIGWMAVAGSPDAAPEDEDAEVLGALAGQIGVAMENMRLFTDLREAHQRLKEAQAQVVQSEKLSAVGRVVSGVAHELNNPLMAIIGFAEVLSAGIADDRTPEIAERMHAQAKRCAGIVQALLAFARRQHKVRAPVCLPEVIRTAADSVEHLRRPGVRVEVTLSSELPIIPGDSGALQQVFANILSNGYHALGEEGRLTVTGELDHGVVTIRIQDDGPGIPDEVLPRIFDPFFTTKGVGKGTGLGLSVSHGIISEHGGVLVADNAPNGGAVFTIHIPVHEAEPEPEPVAAAPLAAQEAPWLA
jgi:signal transduction histidine kinase/ActR/RegA family two-component response regulator